MNLFFSIVSSIVLISTIQTLKPFYHNFNNELIKNLEIKFIRHPEIINRLILRKKFYKMD